MIDQFYIKQFNCRGYTFCEFSILCAWLNRPRRVIMTKHNPRSKTRNSRLQQYTHIHHHCRHSSSSHAFIRNHLILPIKQYNPKLFNGHIANLRMHNIHHIQRRTYKIACQSSIPTTPKFERSEQMHRLRLSNTLNRV